MAPSPPSPKPVASANVPLLGGGLDAVVSQLPSATQQLAREVAPEIVPAVVAAAVTGVDPFAASSFPIQPREPGDVTGAAAGDATVTAGCVASIEDMWESSTTMSDALTYMATLPKGSRERRVACSVLLLRYLPSLERSSTTSDQQHSPFRNCSNSIMEECAFKIVGDACTIPHRPSSLTTHRHTLQLCPRSARFHRLTVTT